MILFHEINEHRGDFGRFTVIRVGGQKRREGLDRRGAGDGVKDPADGPLAVERGGREGRQQHLLGLKHFLTAGFHLKNRVLHRSDRAVIHARLVRGENLARGRDFLKRRLRKKGSGESEKEKQKGGENLHFEF